MSAKTIKFLKHCVTDGTTRARVDYSNGVLIDGSKPVTLYARDYGHALGQIFAGLYQNDSDLMTDYFDKGHVRIPVGHPLYAAALARCEQNERDHAARRAAKAAA